MADIDEDDIFDDVVSDDFPTPPSSDVSDFEDGNGGKRRRTRAAKAAATTNASTGKKLKNGGTQKGRLAALAAGNGSGVASGSGSETSSPAKKRKRAIGSPESVGEAAMNEDSEDGAENGGLSSESDQDDDDNELVRENKSSSSEFLRRLFKGRDRPVKDLGGLALKNDHESRPLWIDNHGKIILEGFSAIAEQAQDFLIAIAEPVSRPSFIHEYKLSEYSLYAAMSVGLETQDIIEVLGRLSKTPLPASLIKDIQRWTSAYGKLKLVLKRNKYSLESAVPEIIQKLLSDDVISECRIASTQETDGLESAPRPTREGLVIPGTEEARAAARAGNLGNGNGDQPQGDGVTDGPVDGGELIGAVIGIDRADEMDEEDRVQSFEIDPQKMERVKRRCQEIGLPVLEEYDFRADTINSNLEIDLKPMTVIRPYQETSLSKMFGNG